MTQNTAIIVPEGVGADDDEIVLSAWFFDDGNVVDADEVVCQLMVSKTSFDVVAPVAGKLRHGAEAEALVRVGDIVGHIEI